MPLQIASLNSGSNANCYYVGNGEEGILIDAGLSCRETLKRMQELGLDTKKLRAIFISHEHTDHIYGLAQLHKKLNCAVFISQKTLRNTAIKLKEEAVQHFEADTAIKIGALTILPFSKHHDAADAHSFMVSGAGVHIGVITDIGYACSNVINCFRQSDAVFLEANYCEEMLSNGTYPVALKKRISGNKGHLSNKQAFELFLKHRTKNLQLLLLSHLSQNNNTPEKALALFKNHAQQVQIVVARRDKATEVYEIKSRNNELSNGVIVSEKPIQLRLFS